MKVPVEPVAGPLADQRPDPGSAARTVELNNIAAARDSQTENDMKKMILDNKCKPGPAGGRTAAWIASVVISACLAVPVNAEVYDDFENAALSALRWTGTVWFGTGTQTVTNGQMKIDVTPYGNHAFSFAQSVRTWTLREGRTLEFRADLVSSNGDGAVGYIAFHLGDGNNGYMLMVDEDTIALHKRSNPLTLFLLTNGAPVKVSNVKLVLSMTGVQSGVLLKVRILDNDNVGAVIFESEYWDTAIADPMQIGSDNPPESFLGQTSRLYLSLYHDNAGMLDPEVTLPHLGKAEVVFDNAEVIEYYPPHLDISRSTNGVDLTWGLPLEEHIVVEADQLPGSWSPCPQPHTRTNDTFYLTLPCQSPEQFFKLIRGTQFTDGFSTLVPSWTPWFPGAGKDWIVTNGALRVSLANQPAYGGLALCPLGVTNAEVVLSDFYASVDILDWVTSSTNWSALALFARGKMSPNSGYFGGLTLNPGGTNGLMRPWLLGPERGYLYGEPFYIHEIPLPYRLQFSMVGTNMSFRVLRLATGQPIREMSWDGWTLTNGIVGLWYNGRTEAGDSYTNTVDNFFMSGTK
jgi:hypothetical protein